MTRTDNRPNTPLEELLGRIVDGGLAGSIFVVPFLMGGRQALGQLVLISLAVIVTVAWLLRLGLRPRAYWRYSSAEMLLGAGLVLVVLQLVPWPESVLVRLSPRIGQLLPLWSPEADPTARLGTWSCISLTPAATQAALSLFVAYGLLFLVTVQRIRAVEDVERLLRWVALAAVAMASFGLLQFVASNEKFFWFYEHPFSDTSDAAKGAFTNRNHFAHFLALGVGPLIWWLQRTHARARKRSGAFARLAKDLDSQTQTSALGAMALGIVLFAGLLSLSRAGMVAMLVAAAVSVAVCYRAKTLAARFVLTLAGVGVLIGALLFVHGYDKVSDRIDELGSASLEKLDQEGARRIVWAAVLQAIPDYALLGAGVGSHREVYPMYLEAPPEIEYTHAENGPLQVTEETGLVGLTLVLSGIALCGVWCVGSLRRAGSTRLLVCAGAVTASLLVNVLHSFADFVWYVPGCMAVVAIMAACACRLWQLAAQPVEQASSLPHNVAQASSLRRAVAHASSVPSRRVRKKTPNQIRPLAFPKPVAMAAAAVVAVAGIGMVVGRIGPVLAEPHWDHYLLTEKAAARARQRENPSLTDELAPQTDGPSAEAITRSIDELQEVVAQDPSHARARLLLTAAYLRRFELQQQTAENVVSLADIAGAAMAARASSTPEEVDAWLSARLGDRREDLQQALAHTRSSLALCPLQGEGYFYLAELRFLEGVDGEAARPAYLDQALRVRPHDGGVLFEAGRAAWQAGDVERGMDYWLRSFHSGERHQFRLIRTLAGLIPVADLIQTFQPDLAGLKALHLEYHRLTAPEQAGHVQQLYADIRRAQGLPNGGADAAMAWLGSELVQLRTHYAQIAQTAAASQKGAEAAKTWLEVRCLYRLLARGSDELTCARRALQCSPEDYTVRYCLADSLAEQQQFTEAEEHLNWCLRQRPDDASLRRKIQEVVKSRIDSQRPIAESHQKPGPLR